MLLSIGASAAATTSSTSFNTTQISQSAVAVKHNVDTKYSLPTSVAVGNTKVTNSQFLYLLTKATSNVATNNKSQIKPKSVAKSTSLSETVTSGTITKSQYLKYANTITTYVTKYGKLPSYVTTSRGKMNYASLIYMYSKVMAYYNVKNALPTTVSVKSWYSQTLGPKAVLNGTAKFTTTLLGKNSNGYVLKLGPFGTGKNKVAVIMGVHPLEVQTHIAMLNAVEALTNSLNNVQIWVYDVVVPNGADYSTGRAAGQNLANKYVVPNIDSSFKLVIDTHGNTGKGADYGGYHNFVFAPLQNSKSLAMATKLIDSKYTNGDLKYHFLADGTSPTYVTIPIAKKGIPTLVFEQYINQANYAKVLYIHAMQVLKAINGIFA